MDGTLSNIQVLRTNRDDMGRAVVAALKKSPKWTPGTIDGKSVRQRMVLPVVFRLD
jgi:protein TonB